MLVNKSMNVLFSQLFKFTSKMIHTGHLKEITHSIESGVRGVFKSGKYEKYLKAMSRFHRYSSTPAMESRSLSA